MAERLKGLVTRTQSGFFTVQTPEGPIICQLRGRLKEEYQETDPVALGDRVIIERLLMDADTVGGAIVEVLERERVLSRVAPSSAVGTSAEREQVIIANPDQAIGRDPAGQRRRDAAPEGHRGAPASAPGRGDTDDTGAPPGHADRVR